MLFDPSPSNRWLLCMTHPDDEISICVWIHRLTQSGAEVWMSWTHDTSVREAEARAVAGQLGVPDDHLYFHGAPDGAVCDHMQELLPRFELMMEQVQPERVVCGAFEQGHIDHDATNWLVNHAFDGMILEVPFYHTYLTRFPKINRFADPTGSEAIDLDAEEQDLKKRIAKSYPSQRIWLNMMAADLRSRLTGDGSLLASEHMRLQTHKDFRTPNLPAELAARVENSTRWKRWLSALP